MLTSDPNNCHVKLWQAMRDFIVSADKRLDSTLKCIETSSIHTFTCLPFVATVPYQLML
jgi:hypothetical protein